MEFINTYQDPYIAARMIGFVGDLVPIKGALLERVRSFCNSQDEEVRRIMAKEVLPRICKCIPDELLQSYLFSNMLEMVYDSDTLVRKHAIQLFFGVQHKFTPDDRNKWVVKYFFELMSSQNEEILKSIS